MPVEFRRLDRTHGVDHLVSICAVDKRMDDLLCVADHGDVRAVRDHNQLTALLYVFDNGDEQTIDRVTVQVFFRLIYDNRAVALVYEQVKDQQQRSTLTPVRDD